MVLNDKGDVVQFSQSLYKNIRDVPDNTKIWRYLTFDKSYYLLADSTIYFCQLKRYEDQQEGDYLAFLPGFLKGDLKELGSSMESVPKIE